jgi:D-alanyl-D-alanine carboxypeptidase
MTGQNGRLDPSELAPIAQGQLAIEAAAAWNAMNVAARARGLELLPNGSKSSYRTYEQQVQLWALYQAGKGNLAAHPGSSNHGLGLAVDVATPQMRAMIDEIGRPYGWCKAWSDAPGEWWHLKYRKGSYQGTDPGPYGPQPTIPDLPEDTMAIAVGTMKDGRLEVFIEKASDGSVWHAYNAKEGGWAADKNGKLWFPMGTPGK